MRIEIIVLSAVIISFVAAERNITPSTAVCAIFPNEEFAIDLKRCQNTCEFYGRKWHCPSNYYKPKGDCYCNAGFARLTEDGKCVSVKKNANCVAKLPISEDSCTLPNESYIESVRMGVCDTSCRKYGCDLEYTPPYEYSWGPNCECKNDMYRRLSNGTCIHVHDEQCIAEYQPSPERCAAVGQIYKVNAPCQQACYNKEYCPPSSGACVCPPNKLAFTNDLYEETQTDYSYTENQFYMQMLTCFPGSQKLRL